MDPRLTGPITGAILAAICFVISRNVLPEDWEGWRVLFVFIAAICLIYALMGTVDWLVFRFNIHLKATRQAWYAPHIHMIDGIGRLNPPQLALLEAVGPFRITGRLAGGEISYYLWTPGGDIPYGWVSDYLDKCTDHFPNLIPQHGLPDSVRRDYIGRFTSLMVVNGLAERAAGNRPAKWNVPLDVVYEKIGLAEE